LFDRFFIGGARRERKGKRRAAKDGESGDCQFDAKREKKGGDKLNGASKKRKGTKKT
jgi:hypothetical protein